MSSRRTAPAIDVERLTKRIEGRIDEAFDTLLKEIGGLRQEVESTQFDVRAGNQARELMSRRLSDLEFQVNQTRNHLQITGEQDAKLAVAAAQTAVAAVAEVASAAPRSVWKTKLGLITAGSAAFVAVVAFFDKLPSFVRGASEIATDLFSYIVRHK